MVSKAVRLIGLCRRAGCVVSGDNAVKASLNRQDCYMIIVAVDASDNIRKKFKAHSEEWGIPMIDISTKEELGDALGIGDIAVLAITHRDFARGILESVKKSGEGLPRGNHL